MAPEPLIGPEELRAAVSRLGREIGSDHPDGVHLIGVLKGSVIFLADLIRHIEAPATVDFVAISRYQPDSGRVRIVKDLDDDITGLDVILVEDIIDTGLTSTYLLRYLAEHGPRRLSTCTMLDRVRRRIVPVEITYRGFELDDEFVLGYGLDFAERYRNLDVIIPGDVRALQGDPDLHVPELFGKGEG